MVYCSLTLKWFVFSLLFCFIRLSSVHVYDCCSRFVVSRPSEYAKKYPPWQRILSFIKYHSWTRDNLLKSNLSGKYGFFYSNKTNWNSWQYFDLHFHKSQKCASKQIMKLRIILCDTKSALLLETSSSSFSWSTDRFSVQRAKKLKINFLLANKYWRVCLERTPRSWRVYNISLLLDSTNPKCVGISLGFQFDCT